MSFSEKIKNIFLKNTKHFIFCKKLKLCCIFE